MTAAASTSTFQATALPRHHVSEDLLLGFAAGTVTEGEAMLVATHAALCPRCTRILRGLEAGGGALLAAEAPVAPSADLLARTLAKLGETPQLPRPARLPLDPVLPMPLVRLIGPFDQIKWVKSLPNTWTLDFKLQHGSVPMRLRRFLPGTRIPTHSHRGDEHDMVLTGAVIDDRDGRTFARGDVATNGESDLHSLTIAPEVECVALSVHAARVRPVGMFARLIFGYTRW